MSKCLKCGAALPPWVSAPPAPHPVRSARSPRLPRRACSTRTSGSTAAAIPERTPSVPGPAAVPSFAELARPAPAATPPGMTPRQRRLSQPPWPRGAALPPPRRRRASRSAASPQAPDGRLRPTPLQSRRIAPHPPPAPCHAPWRRLGPGLGGAAASAQRLAGSLAAPVAQASDSARTSGLPRRAVPPGPCRWCPLRPLPRAMILHRAASAAPAREPHTPRLPMPAAIGQ